MNYITKIGLKGVGPFVDSTVFEVPSGITYLYGKNLLAGGNPNASGKSVFASSLAEIFYDEPIIGTRQDKAKSGSRFVVFKRGRKTIKVASGFKGKSSKLSVTVDGEDKSGRTNANTKEVLEKVWPLTQTDYLTYAYMDNSVPHPLVKGSTAERKSFFMSFFALDRLDAEKKVVQAELHALRKAKAARAELQTAYDDVKKDLLTKDAYVKLKGTAEKLQGKIKKLQADAEEYQRVAQIVEFRRLALPHIDAVGTDNITARLKAARKLVAQYEEYEEQLHDYKSYVKSMERYKEQTANLDMTADLDELKEASQKYLKAASYDSDIDEPRKVEKPAKPKTDRKELQREEATLEHKIEHAAKFKKGVCDMCGQEVKAESPEKLKKRLAEVEEALEAWNAYDSGLRKYENYQQAVEHFEKEKAKAEAAAAMVKKYKKSHELYEKRSKLSKPSKVEKPAKLDGIEKARKEISSLEFLAPHEDMLGKLDVELPEYDPVELNSLQDKLSTAKAALEVHEVVKGRASRLRNRMEELDAELLNEEALKLLLDGYSDKAVKKMVIDAISNHLVTTLNSYSKLVFSDYKFEFVWGTQVQLLVHRPKLPTTDVRKLSGAESKLFTLILVLALMKFVPKRKRLSLLVLDEPTASFSAETTALFHQLLPQLNDIIPSILVVTPKSEERLEGATEFTVVRDKSGSRIVTGHPDDI